MNFKEIVAKVSKEIDIPEDVVATAYRSYFQFIRTVITDLPLKNDITEEEFNNLRTSFNLPSLGKLYTTYQDICNVKKRYEIIKKIKNDKSSKDDKTQSYGDSG